MADRKETAADITVTIGSGEEVVVERLTMTKQIDVETVYGSGRTLPDGYGINQISYQGQMELQGNRLDLEDTLFDDNGIPVEATITVTHFNGEETAFTEVIATSDGWEMSSGEITTTTFEFVAMGRQHAGQVDNEP